MFTPIDQSTWPRREHFAYYRNTLPCANSVTTHLDVTKFRAMLQKNHIKFYPAFIWCVSHTLLSHPDFRLAVAPTMSCTPTTPFSTKTTTRSPTSGLPTMRTSLRSTGRSWLTWKPTATSTA